MNSSRPPPSLSPATKKPTVAVGVSVACLVYALSLPLQRAFPALKELLGLPLGEGLWPTYYLRVALSLLAGVVLATAAASGRPRSERLLAWGTAAAVLASAALICAFP